MTVRPGSRLNLVLGPNGRAAALHVAGVRVGTENTVCGAALTFVPPPCGTLQAPESPRLFARCALGSEALSRQVLGARSHWTAAACFRAARPPSPHQCLRASAPTVFPQNLGRAEDTKSFVRRGASSCWIETTLSSGGEGRDYVIRRTITLRNERVVNADRQQEVVQRYSSDYKINGRREDGGG